MPALANHLLQSTIFAALAGILTLCLRNNHARTRYWIWLTASIKFLIPFALFVDLGHKLTLSTAPVIVQPRLVFVMDEISQPFSAPQAVPIVRADSIMPELLFAAWILGSATVLIFWFIRWRRIAAIVKASVPITEGRELSALRRMDQKTNLIFSPSRMEPGVFGIFKPVLSLPAGISDHLNDAQLDAIFAHELSHVHHRDNLTAALHMLVEAVFWFHPLVWWIGAKLVDERERACDEDVVRRGSDPEIYAESILRICRLYLESPLVCAAGISGSDLGKRIENIMTNPMLSALSRSKKLMIGAMGLIALIAPITAGVISAAASHVKPQTPSLSEPATAAPPPSEIQTPHETAPEPLKSPAPTPPPKPSPRLEFDAASIKPSSPAGAGSRFGCQGGPGSKDPGRLDCTHVGPNSLIMTAYNLKRYQVLAGDYATRADGYDVTATIPEGTTKEQYRLMLQNLLADRFKLAAHFEKKEMPVYELAIGKGGAKVKPSTPKEDDPPFDPRAFDDKNDKNGYPVVPPGMTMFISTGDHARYQGRAESMENMAAMLSNYEDRPVIDATGLKGLYDFSMYFVPYRAGAIPPADAPGPTLLDAIEQQLGLKLVSAKDPIDVLVIDHLEKAPTEN